MAEKKRTASLVKVGTPQFLSLVGLPANQSGFKIVREDGTEKENSMPTVQSKRTRTRIKRSDPSLLSITLPAGTSEDDANGIMVSFGLVDDYDLTSDGVTFVLQRRGAEEETGVSIGIGNGMTATIKPNLAIPAAPVLRSDDLPAIAVTSIRFALDAFPENADVKRWADEHGIVGEPVATEDSFVVSRSAVADGIETREVTIEQGVTAIIVRAAIQDVPATIVNVVDETAYGSYGWGQLDFLASMADEDFCDEADEAMWLLRNVLNNIIFYSALPLDMRKELILRATMQYGAYMATLLDALPRGVIAQIRSALPTKQEVVPMDVKKTEDAAGTKTAEEIAAAAALADSQPVTRGEITALVTAAVTAALAAPATKEVARSDAAPAGDDAEPVTDESAPAEDALTQIMRSTEAIATTLSAVTDRLTALEGTTIVRSETGDEVTRKAGDTKVDVFAGSFLTGGVAKE